MGAGLFLPAIIIACCFSSIILCSGAALGSRSYTPDRDKNIDYALFISMICLSLSIFFTIFLPLFLGYSTLNFVGIV